MKRFFPALFLSALFGLAPRAAAAPESTVLWYAQPATHWLEALPIGNGRMGGMVFGGVAREQVQFNEQTLWLGGDKTQDMGGYQPFGDLYLDFEHGAGAVTNYRRELDLDRAVNRVTYTVGDVTYVREAFASHPAGIVAVRLSANQPRRIRVTVRLTDAHEGVITAAADTVSSAGRLPNGLSYAAAARVVSEGGRITTTGGRVAVADADTVTILLAAATDFARDFPQGRRGPEPVAAVAGKLRRAATIPYAALQQAHVADHQALFRRVRLDLGAGAISARPTDERLAANAKGPRDPALAALLFNYGRYLLIACSRPGGLPANLQGLWNANPKPAWFSGYTTNINVEMNYWPAEPTALPECHEPLFEWIEHLAAVQKRSTDPRLKTSTGWIIYSTNNPFGGNTGWAIHQPGSAWLAQHPFEHFAFTGDRLFLAERAYPLLRELTRYWADRLVPGAGGRLVTPDGWSPEHGPVKENGKIVLKEGDRAPHPGVSYDQQIVWDLFTNFIEASTVLGADPAMRAEITATRDKLLGPTVGRWGQIQEWMEDVDDPADHHRHVSHLFALHPGRQISPVATPDWAAAAKVSLNARGDGATGWSRAWKVNFWARLLDGDRAESILGGLLNLVPPTGRSGGSYPNLFGAHPPFQMDSNFGATAGIAEMLLQSHARDAAGVRVIHLLPALPAAWADGSVTGLRARGGCEVDLRWRGGRLVAATVRTLSGPATFVVRYGAETRPVSLESGKTYTWQ